MNYFLSILIGYLFGCYNLAYIIGRIKGIDLKKVGSKNTGASNVGMMIGLKYAILVAISDILKAFVAYKLCAYLFGSQLYGQIAGAMVVIGHNHPFYLHFDGGKGFASFVGLLIAFNPLVALILGVIHLTIVYISKYMVYGTFAFIGLAPIAAFILKDFSFAIILIIVALFVVERHKQNIINFINGTEFKITDVKK